MENTTSNQNTELKATASVTTPDLGIAPDECVATEPIDPCTIVIVGATGDLTARKLMPALFNLYLSEGLPEPFQIVGCGRTDLDSSDFREKMKAALQSAGMFKPDGWPSFAAALHYRTIDYKDLDSYSRLAESLRKIDRQNHTRGNRIFYIALPPVLYMTVAEMIGRSGLSAEQIDGNDWSRIVVEKPFGTNLQTAVELDQSLLSLSDSQIFTTCLKACPQAK